MLAEKNSSHAKQAAWPASVTRDGNSDTGLEAAEAGSCMSSRDSLMGLSGMYEQTPVVRSTWQAPVNRITINDLLIAMPYYVPHDGKYNLLYLALCVHLALTPRNVQACALTTVQLLSGQASSRRCVSCPSPRLGFPK